jgi:hypothetical protein
MTRPTTLAPAVAALAVVAAGFAFVAPAFAQPAPGTTSADASLSAYGQLDADLDKGGQAGMYGVLASGSVMRQFTPQFAAGLTLRYDYESWSFDNPVAFGGRAPWNDIQRPSVAIPMRYAVTADTIVGVIPTLQWAFENGASTGDALIYGGIVSVARVFSPTLTLGIGAGVYHEINRTKAFPFLLVDWKIDSRWRLANPFPAGPAGGAGLELAYAASDAWELAAGGTWRQFRFRLDRNGPVPNGIGETSGIPLFARATYRFGPQARIDAYAGAVLGGKLTAMNSDGNDVARDELGAAPLVGLTISSRF